MTRGAGADLSSDRVGGLNPPAPASVYKTAISCVTGEWESDCDVWRMNRWPPGSAGAARSMAGMIP